MQVLRGKKITILGFASSGREAARLAATRKAKIKISDQADTPQIRKAIEGSGLKNIEVELGGHSEQFIQDSDMVILSPGIRLDSPAVKYAADKNIPVISEIELGFRFCPARIVAITGSNGKTTVTTLVAEILRKTGRRVFACGNIGNPFCGVVDKLKPDDLVSLEVSSFQLETIVKFRPYVAVFLNFSRNHLDRHADMEEYLAQKKRIFLNQTAEDFAVLNHQDPVVRALATEIKAKIVYFNSPGDNDPAVANPNFLAAQAVGEIFKVSRESCLEVFNNFKGVEHRMEFVRNLQGVDFVNDSKATTVESAVWALSRLDKPIIMIAGGRDKGLDFTAIRELVKGRVREMVVIGEAKEKLKKAFAGALPLKEAADLKDAVSLAARDAHRGDCVLLCPMCTSFDMFVNFEERGRVFKELVNRL